MANMNMMELTIDQFTQQIKEDLLDENYDPIVGIGKSGVGKTMSIHELTQELGIGFCELRLVTLTEIDMLGIPVIENGRTTYASNALLPDATRDGEAGILVLDEITSATSTVRAAAYQLTDSKRRLGNYVLPKHWKVVSLGNGLEDGGVYTGMESAYLSRAMSYRIIPDLPTWKKWAIKNGVNSSVIAYLTFDPSKLHVFDPDEEVSVFPCPRSWTALSTRLNAREKRNGGMLSPDQVEVYAAGAVGVTEAANFAGFYAYNSKTLSSEDIISGKCKDDISNLDPEVIYLVIQSLIKELGKVLKDGHKGVGEFTPECVTKTANVINWLVDISNTRLDYTVTALHDLQAGVDLFDEMVLMCDNFNTACPKFLQLAVDIGIVFD